jgi:hypothetical protein
MYQIITTDGHESRSAIITDSFYEACETGRAISLIDGGIDAVLFHIDADQPVFMFRNGIKCWLDGEPIRGVA